MKRIILSILLLVFATGNVAGQNYDFFPISGQYGITLFMLEAPGTNEEIYVYRSESGGDFELLNGSSPLGKILNADEAKTKISKDYASLLQYTGSSDLSELLVKLRSNSNENALISLLFTDAAKITGRWFVDSTASLNKDYTYRIKYVSKMDTTKVITENSKSFTSQVPVLLSPIELKQESGDKYVKLSWNYPVWQGSYNDLAIKFYVYRSSGTGSFEKVNSRLILRNDLSEKVFMDQGVENGKTYKYYVTAVDPVGNESERGQVISATPFDNRPPVPPGGINSVSKNKLVTLTWYKNDEADMAGYNVYRIEAVSQNEVKLNKALVNPNVTMFADSTVSNGLQYFYHITAVDKNGNESKNSNSVPGLPRNPNPPVSPKIAKAEFAKGKINISWKANTEENLLGYYVYRGSDEKLLARITNEPIMTTTFVDSGYGKKGFSEGKSYTYFVTAVNEYFEESDKKGSAKVKIPDITPPLVPKRFRIEPTNLPSVVITVGHSRSKDAFKFNLYKILGGQAGKKLLKSFTATPFTYVDRDVTLLHDYKYGLSVVDTAGNESEVVISEKITVADKTPPPQIRYLYAIKKDDRILVNWEPVYDKDLVGYNVYRSYMPNGRYEKINNEPVTSPTFSDEKRGRKTFYKVKSVDSSGNESSWSAFTHLKRPR